MTKYYAVRWLAPKEPLVRGPHPNWKVLCLESEGDDGFGVGQTVDEWMAHCQPELQDAWSSLELCGHYTDQMMCVHWSPTKEQFARYEEAKARDAARGDAEGAWVIVHWDEEGGQWLVVGPFKREAYAMRYAGSGQPVVPLLPVNSRVPDTLP